ncbi:MAG TPA: Hsp20/alpha crystallin family protein [Clostridiales bacterium]|nr:Hsp20/alpha crystallin family protein [Clostridiales bacterium]
MLLPSIFENNFVDSFFDDMFNFNTPLRLRRRDARLINTDIKDLGDKYLLDMELPGYDKNDIRVELRNGYLSVEASKDEIRDEKNDDGKYVRRERYYGKSCRSFYVGDYLKDEDIKASFDNGVLKLEFPKENKTAQVEEKRYIPIE